MLLDEVGYSKTKQGDLPRKASLRLHLNAASNTDSEVVTDIQRKIEHLAQQLERQTGMLCT